jgi:hypothetical protein
MKSRLLRRENNACFLLVGNFPEISFSSKVVTACGPGDSAHLDRRGREAEDAKDLGRLGNVWKVYNLYDFVERAVRWLTMTRATGG